MSKPLSFLALALAISFYCQGQSGANSLPTTGNVSIGTSTSPNTLTVNGTLVTNGSITQTGGTANSTTGYTTYLLTNTTIGGSNSYLNPGLCVYRDRWFDYGIDLGYNATSTRASTRIFCPNTANICLSYINETGTVPTLQSQLTDALTVLGGSGNVLIGKSTQGNSSYMLDVAGNVRANQLTVNANGADFVFDSAYALRSLTELAAYIKSNHHLPEMATAGDMKKDGLNLGDNQIKLLQKVEELTLYSIDAYQQIQQLKALNSRQEAALTNQEETLKAQQQTLKEQEETLKAQQLLLSQLQARLKSE